MKLYTKHAPGHITIHSTINLIAAYESLEARIAQLTEALRSCRDYSPFQNMVWDKEQFISEASELFDNEAHKKAIGVASPT